MMKKNIDVIARRPRQGGADVAIQAVRQRLRRDCFVALLLAMTLVPSISFATPKAAYIWSEQRPGLQYATYSLPISEKDFTTIHAFKIDPAKFKFKVLMAADEKLGATAEELAKKSKALLAVNGGFFTPEHKSIGLIVNDGKKLSPIHKTSWWSIFFVQRGKASIVKPGQFDLTDDIETALQVGPRLVTSGKVQKLKEGVAPRTAIGITQDGMVVIAVTTGKGISLNELAMRMSKSMFEGGLSCVDAMALDGGGSTQVYAKVGKLKLSLTGISLVTNGIGIFQR